jgi:enamine deaminase RidA (YjgF/YER057c/UK114 family)
LSVYETLESLKIELPALTKPVAAFVQFTRVGGLVFVSGHIAMKNGKPWEGQLGADLTIEQGKEAARGVAIDLIATLNAAVGDLNLVRRIVKMQVLVNSTPGFHRPTSGRQWRLGTPGCGFRRWWCPRSGCVWRRSGPIRLLCGDRLDRGG